MSVGMFSFFCAVSLVAVPHIRAKHPDIIESLPGLDKFPVTYRQYSGYLDTTGSKKLHYWFVESQGNATTDPVILWLNGGPGCSSLEGLLSEHGPVHVNDDGQTLYENPYSWNKVANVIYLESPVGVGFSYAEDPEDMKVINDDQTSTDNLAAVQSFFDKFPQFKDNDFYIFGESYAGIYVPTLAAKLVDKDTFKFKGFGIGNGLHSWEKNQQSIVYFAYYHGLFGVNFWNSLVQSCCKQGSESDCDFFNYPTRACKNLVNQAVEITWSSGLDVYDLYGDCAGGLPAHFSRWRMAMSHLFNTSGLSLPAPPKPQTNGSRMLTFTKGVGDVPPCVDETALTNWLNLPTVKEALHIPDSVQNWTVCNDELNYKTLVDDTSEYIQHVLNNYRAPRALVYNGDTDMACNYLGGQLFVEALGLQVLSPKDKPQTKPWTYNNQIAGFFKKFRNLTFLTVKGAGHMVPKDKPGQALAMLENFLHNKF